MPLIVSSALVMGMNALTSLRFDRVSWLMTSGDRAMTRRKKGRQLWLAGLLAMATVGVVAPEAIASRVPVSVEHASEVSMADSSSESSSFLISQVTPSPTLRLGASGDAVTSLQQSLADLGYYSGPITGYFGEQTEQAVKEFQSSNGLTADGIVGSGTLSAIANADTPTVEATPGSVREGTTGELVVALQERLSALGYYTGAVDGVFGRGTTSAVVRFQEQNGLVADGVVGSATEAALRSADAVPASASTSQSSSSPSPSITPTPSSGVLRLGSSGREVIVLQSQLQALGYYSGAVDGNFGESTKAAVIEFQTAQGLVGDGLVGPQTTYLLDEQFFAMRSPETPSATPQAPAAPSPQPSAAPAPSPSAAVPSTVSPAPPMTFPGATPLPSPNAPTQVPPAAVSVPTTPTVVPSPQPSLPPAAAIPAPAPAPVQIAEQGSYTVLEIQQKLYQQGLYDGPLDGVMNPQIERAIQEAQQEHGLSPADLAQ